MKMTKRQLAVAMVLSITFSSMASADGTQQFTMIPPHCRTPSAQHPVFAANNPSWYRGTADDLFADFNGDGVCDYAVKVAYPFNSKMPCYSLDEIMVLGAKTGWRRPFNGKPWPNVYDVLTHAGQDANDVATNDVDLTVAELVYRKGGGVPYVARIYYRGQPEEGLSFQCEGQLKVLHRWDDTIGTFRIDRSDDAKAALKFYLSQPSKTCPDIDNHADL